MPRKKGPGFTLSPAMIRFQSYFSKVEASLWWKSMAVAVIFGLAVATMLTLLVVPVLTLAWGLRGRPLVRRAGLAVAVGAVTFATFLPWFAFNVARFDEPVLMTSQTGAVLSAASCDSTFYGDLFAHVVDYQGELYLEEGLHRALRAALQQRATLHARVLVLH